MSKSPTGRFPSISPLPFAAPYGRSLGEDKTNLALLDYGELEMRILSTMAEEKKIPVSSRGLYKAYKAWRDQDVENDSTYAKSKRTYGLCGWISFHQPNSIELEDQMRVQFLVAGLDPITPFDKGSYSQQAQTGTQHLNPARVKWVDDRIADYEKANGL